MKFFKATVADRNAETYEVLVNFDDSGKDNETAKFLSTVACDPLGGGLHTLPPVGTRCIVVMDSYNDYWVLGYYNVTGGDSVNGWIMDDKFPRPVLGDNDALLRHTGGNYILQTEGELRIWEGLSARMSLVGKTNNSYDLYALRIKMNNSAGYFSWQTLNNDPDIDTPSSFEWKIQKNFEQFADITPSDYTIIRSGSIIEDEDSEAKTHVFDMATTQYVPGTITESATTYLSLSRDDEDNLLKLEISDIDNQGKTSYTINSGYYHNWTISDASRTATFDILHDDGSTNLKIDLNGTVTVTATDEGNLNLFSKTDMNIDIGGETTIFADTSKYFIDAPDKISLISPKIYIGKEDETEPLALGASLMAKLNELIDDYKLHMHPTPAGPSGAPLPPTANLKNHVADDYLSKVSFTIKILKK
jgi:hypothetical protein